MASLQYFAGLLLLLLRDSSEESSMVIVSGKPAIFDNFEAAMGSWESCLANCRENDECIVAYKVAETECHIFLFGSIKFIEKSYSGDEIAIKAVLSEEQCPSTNPLLSVAVYSFENVAGQLYTAVLSIDDSQNYNLNYSIITCPSNTKLFQRTTAVVCIGLFMFENLLCNNFAQGSARCMSNNGTLTGPANSIEYEYIQAQSNSSYDTYNPNGYKYLTYWIDGVGTPTKYVYTFEDQTHNGIANYQWANGTPMFVGAEYCLYNPNALGLYISDLE